MTGYVEEAAGGLQVRVDVSGLLSVSHSVSILSGGAVVYTASGVAGPVVATREGAADLRVFDVRGRLVSALRSGRSSSGAHRVTWSGDGTHGSPVGAGVYFLQLSTEAGRVARKVTVLR